MSTTDPDPPTDAARRERTSTTLDRALTHLVDHDMAAFAALR